MLTREDLSIGSLPEFLSFSLIFAFVGLIAPFLLAVYTYGYFADMVGWLDT